MSQTFRDKFGLPPKPAVVQELTQDLTTGSVTPEEALTKFEVPSQSLADIQVEFEMAALPCGMPSFENNFYLRRNEPDLVVLGARPGHGKTALGLQLGLHVSSHTPVMFFSIEMTKSQLKKRLLSNETGRSALQLAHPDNAPLIAKANKKFERLRFQIDDENGLDLNTLKQRARDYKKRQPLGLIIVDYLQIVRAPQGRTRTEEVNHIAQQLKNLALELKCPVLALAQMSRTFENRINEDPSARPLMSDFADSAGIEKFSDVLLVQHKLKPNLMRVFCIKNRNYELADFNLQFSGELMRFIDDTSATF